MSWVGWWSSQGGGRGGDIAVEVEGDGASQPAVSPAVRRNVGLRAGVSCVRRDACFLAGSARIPAKIFCLPCIGQPSVESRDLTLPGPEPSDYTCARVRH